MDHRPRTLALAAAATALLATARDVPAQVAPRNAPGPTIEVGVANGELRVNATGFPAVGGARGRTVVATITEHDAAGSANLAVVFFDAVTGRQTRRIDVLSPRQARDAMRRSPPPRDVVSAATGRAQRAMEALAASGGAFAQLPGAEAARDASGEPAATVTVTLARGEAWTVQHDGRRVRAFRGAVAQGAPAADAPLPRARGRGPCRDANPPFVGAAFALPGAILVRTDFRGNDTCWSPAPVWTLLRTAAAPAR